MGTLYGAISGYLGGRVDNLMMRGVEVLYALPDFLLIILMTVVIGRGVFDCLSEPRYISYDAGL